MITTVGMKLLQWLLPNLLYQIGEYLELAVSLVEQAESIPDQTQRQAKVAEGLSTKYSFVPSVIVTTIIQIALVLYRLGVTADSFDAMEKVCQDAAAKYGWSDLYEAQKRTAILKQFSDIFPDLPGRLVDLIFQVTLMRGRV